MALDAKMSGTVVSPDCLEVEIVWPKSIRATKVFLVDGGVACYLTHDEVRELGRILIQPAGPGGS